MRNNSSEPGKQLYEEYEHALFQLVMHDAAEQEGSCLLEENQRIKAFAESLPPEEALRKFTEQLDAHLRKQKVDARRKKLPRLLRRVAVAVVAICFVFFTAMTTVHAFRVEVMNFWMSIQPQYTIFRLKENENTTSRENLVVGWANAYVPTYVPEEYVVSSVTVTQLLKRVVFQAEKASIVYMEMTGATSPTVDTENASRLETVSINGLNGMLVEKSGLVTVIWSSDERMFMVQTQADVETAMKVAEGVKFIK